MSSTRLTSRRLAIAGIVGPIVWWVLVAVNGAITPGYSHESDFISSLGGVGAPYAIPQQVNFVVFGGSIIALTLGIHYWFDKGHRPRVGTILLGIFGVGLILSGIFQENVAAPDSTTNILHDIVGIIAFIAGIIAITVIGRRFGRADQWPTMRFESIVVPVIVLLTFVVFMYSVTSEWAVIGLTQRAFIGVISLWLVVQASRLHRVAMDPVPELNHPTVREGEMV